MATETEPRLLVVLAPAPVSRRQGEGEAIRSGCAPAPMARDIVRLRERQGLSIGARGDGSRDGSTFATIDRATERSVCSAAFPEMKTAWRPLGV